MLKDFESSFQAFIPPQTEEDGLQPPEYLKDIDSLQFDNFDQKVWDVWNEATIDHTKRYEKIFHIFFKSFCNKLGKNEEINSETGQWMQSKLERMGIMGIPIETMIRSTAVIITPQGTESYRLLFNKELSGRMIGAEATIKYVAKRKKEEENVRILIDDNLDRFFATDLLEICNFETDDRETLIITQIKSQNTIDEEDIETIHAKHIKLLIFFRQQEKEWQKDQESKRENFEKAVAEMYEKLEDMQLIMLEILEESPNMSPKEVISQTAKRLQMENNELWQILFTISNEYSELFDEEIRPIFEYVLNAPAPTPSIKTEYVIMPSRYKKIISRISNGDQIISEVVLN
jgi:hypothetical protein